MNSESRVIDKQALYDYLHGLGIRYEVTEHQAVYSMTELSEVFLPYPGAIAKNLFVRDDKRQHYYLISVKGDKRVDLKALRRSQGTRPLSFAGEDELRDILHLKPGAVTPFALLNDAQCWVHFFLDRDFLAFPGMIGVHPNDNTATVWLHTADLLRIIAGHGNAVKLI